jgi:glutamine synthetase
MIDMASKHILPAMLKYTRELADTINSVREAGVDTSVQKEILMNVTLHLVETRNALKELCRVAEEVRNFADVKEKAEYCHNVVRPAMDALRAPVDKLEMIVAKEDWPMPSYGDLIFEV